MTDRHVRYAAVHAFALVEPETGRSIGMASWGNAILSRAPLADGFAAGLPRPSDADVVEVEGAVHPWTGAPHPLIGSRFGDTEPGHREPRCVVGGTYPLEAAGRARHITIATTHLTYIGRAQRRAQADAVRAALDERPGATVLTGDFNARVEAPELAALGPGFEDAFAAVGVPVGDARRESCGVQPIDHVRVRGLRVESCRVATEAGDASDHWPVVADLVLGGA
jgi:hypothetical protein